MGKRGGVVKAGGPQIPAALVVGLPGLFPVSAKLLPFVPLEFALRWVSLKIRDP